jgi:formate hydrogenlyase transcriptional activator
MNPELSLLYQVLIDLVSLAECRDPDRMLVGLYRTLRTALEFDYLGLLLNEGNPKSLCLQVMCDGQSGDRSFRSFAISDTPIGWVWDKQETVVIPCTEKEIRWPAFMHQMVSAGFLSIIALPLIAVDRKIGVLAIARRIEYEPVESELAFLQQVAAELAVTIKVYLTHKELTLEHERLRVLNEITNALISKLSPDELFAAISNQLQKVISHSSASIALWDREASEAELYLLQISQGDTKLELPRRWRPLDTIIERAISQRQAVVLDSIGLTRINPEIYRFIADRGDKSMCVLPLITPNAVLGTLNLTGQEPNAFSNEDVRFLSQVAGQIAIAIENSLVYQEIMKLKEKLATEKLYLEEEIRLDKNLTEMVGQSPALQAVINCLQIVAPTDSTVLILGETGTGKELVARALHDLSGRKQHTFVKLSCAAIPATLLESELFGHEKGAFTGATNSKIGRFELAHKGTLFLDEVGEIPLELQAKLLRAIQEQEFERLGSNRTIRVDVRIVAATNRDLKKMIEENQFRNDLYYRLSVFPIRVPPLRERREDIPLLIRHFAQKFAKRLGRTIEVIPSGVVEYLAQYSWPGNIRELQNLIERSVILTTGQALQVPLAEIQGKPKVSAVKAEPIADSAAERDRIIRALKEADGIIGGPGGAAARLGLKRTTLQARMKKLNIQREYRYR